MRSFLAVVFVAAIATRQVNGASCGTVNVNGMSYDLNNLPVGYFTADMSYNGGTSTYVWGMSLCSAQPGPSIYPNGQGCADDPTFLQQFRAGSSGTCDSGYNNLVSTSVSNNVITMQYSVTNCPSATCRYTSYTATVNIQCGSATTLTPIGDVQASGPFPNINFVFNLQYNGICGGAPPAPTATSPSPNPPSPTPPLRQCGNVTVNGMSYDLNNLPVGYFTADQSYNGGTSTYVWGLSLCSAQPGPSVYPNGQVCADDPTFLQQFRAGSSGTCDAAYNNWISTSVTNNIITMQYSVANCPSSTCRYTSYTATVNIQCGSSPSLTPIGDIQASGAFPNINFLFNLQFNGICAPPPTPSPPPTPVPPPNCGNVTVNGTTFDLSTLPMGYLIGEETYQWQNTPYVWGLSLCSPQPSSGLYPLGQPCGDGPSFVQQFESNGNCTSAFNNHVSTTVEDGLVVMQYSVVNCPSCPFAFYFATVTLQCLRGTGDLLQLIGDVQGGGTYPYEYLAINLGYEGLCPPLPPTPTPTPAINTCGIVTVNGISVNLNLLPPVYFTAPQQYNNGVSLYTWAVSLCTAEPSYGIYPAGRPCGNSMMTFVQQFDSLNNCVAGYDVFEAPQVVNNSILFQYHVVNCPKCESTDYRMTVRIRCGANTTLAPAGPIMATGRYPYLVYDMDLEYAGICGN